MRDRKWTLSVSEDELHTVLDALRSLQAEIGRDIHDPNFGFEYKIVLIRRNETVGKLAVTIDSELRGGQNERAP